MIKLRALLISLIVFLTLVTTFTFMFPVSVHSANNVSFFFDEADVYEVIQSIFGDVLKVNYVIDSGVKGTVNFRTTTPIPREDLLPVMEIILRLNGIGIVEEQGVYAVVPLANIVKEPSPIHFGNEPKDVEIKGMVIVQIIPIENITSTDLVKIITPFLTKGAALMDMPEHNFLVLSDVDKNIKRILEIIDIFDEEAYQDIIRPDIYVYSLKNSRADNVAKILQELFLGGAKGQSEGRKKPLVKTTPKAGTSPITRGSTRQQSGTGIPAARTQQVRELTKAAIDEEPLVAPGTKIFHDEASNSIIILATKADYKLIEQTIKKIDLIPRQVLIEVLVADITLNDELALGIEWFIRAGDNRIGHGTSGNVFDVGGIPSDENIIGLGLPQGLTYFNRGKQVTVLLRALASEGKLNVLASPHIIASDNNESKIQIGTEEPIITQNEDVGTGDTSRVVQNVQYRDTGIILTVKPQINAGGLISLDVKTEDSRIEEGRRVGGSPPFIKTETVTNLIVQDGETIVIGGLIQSLKNYSEEGIPFLRKIPWLGILFKAKRERTRKRELIITLTPRVIRNQEEAEIVSQEFRDKLKFLLDEVDVENREMKENFFDHPDYNWRKTTKEKE